MVRLSWRLLLLLAALIAMPSASHAVDPHFAECTATPNGDVLTFEGKIAGLGRQREPLQLEATATAVCVDLAPTPGPLLVVAQPVSTSATLPPPQGNAKYEVALEASFTPPCDAPLVVVFADSKICDTTHNICCPP